MTGLFDDATIRVLRDAEEGLIPLESTALDLQARGGALARDVQAQRAKLRALIEQKEEGDAGEG